MRAQLEDLLVTNLDLIACNGKPQRTMTYKKLGANSLLLHKEA